MALLTIDERKAIFKELGLGEYNKTNIKAFQKKYMLRKSDWDGIYGQNTDNTLRTVYYTKVYTKNFKPSEFQCECGGKYCCGYPSYMKPAELIHIQAIRDRYGKPITITSGLRCKTWNSKCGGSIQNSLHMSGLALDFYQQGVTDTLANRKAHIKEIASDASHHYTYGNGIYRLTTNKTYSGSVKAPYMGNALHTDCYDKVQPEHPKWTESPSTGVTSPSTPLVDESKPPYKFIDVSNWQDKIDWSKVRADGVVGAIIRYGDGSFIDTRFDENMKNAKAAGLHIGAYIYSRAKTAEQARSEAERMFNACKPYGCDMPLYIDLETKGLEKYADTVAIAFLNKIKALGGRGGVYANLHWWNNYLKKTAKDYSSNAFWIAQYNDTMDYKPASKMGMWQYTSSGKVNGISGKVDMDLCYVAYWEKIKSAKETVYDKICAWAKKIAADDDFHYVKWKEKDKKTHECPICKKHEKGEYYGGNCIWFAWASWRHGGGIKSKCSCGAMTDQLYEKVLKAKTDKEALKLVQDRIGIDDIKVTRSNKGLDVSKLKKGTIIAYFKDETYVHTALVVEDGKIADCTSGRKDNIKYGVKPYTKWKAKIAFEYTGK